MQRLVPRLFLRLEVRHIGRNQTEVLLSQLHSLAPLPPSAVVPSSARLAFAVDYMDFVDSSLSFHVSHHAPYHARCTSAHKNNLQIYKKILTYANA